MKIHHTVQPSGHFFKAVASNGYADQNKGPTLGKGLTYCQFTPAMLESKPHINADDPLDRRQAHGGKA